MAAPTKAKAAGKKNKKAAGGGAGGNSAAGMVLWVLIAIVGMAFLALPSVIVSVVLLVPTIVAAIVDRSRDHHAVLAVGSLNFAGAVPALIDLWGKGHTIGAAGRVLADPYSWLAGFGAAAIGWLLLLGLPKILEVAMTLRNEAEIRRLQERQAALIAEWGPDIAGKPKADGARGSE